MIDKALVTFTTNRDKLRDAAHEIAMMVFYHAAPSEIGDECTTSVDCSPEGDRMCDIAQRGGYCTIRDCTPDSCPDDADAADACCSPAVYCRRAFNAWSTT